MWILQFLPHFTTNDKYCLRTVDKLHLVYLLTLSVSQSKHGKVGNTLLKDFPC